VLKLMWLTGRPGASVLVVSQQWLVQN